VSNVEKIVAVGLVLGWVLSGVGLCMALGAGWAAVWAGILMMVAALMFDAG
jgi:hypothetical protein